MTSELMWAMITAGCLVPIGLWIAFGPHCNDTFGRK